ncbi:UvrD-helicase domain-containing protein [Sphingomonas sp. PWP1-2]|uniref:UvrD-helicase domain-containing protein n=1 Tax=Sphingomonas sp. PWP1-2 TaxID=2804558 RepID=UPI003CE9B3AF
MSKYILISESALDAALVSGEFSADSMLPLEDFGIYKVVVNESTVGYRIANEPTSPILALIGEDWLEILHSEGGSPSEAFRRVARVIKGMKSPPVHLPRQWSEYHHKNLLTFFALPREVSSLRWVVDINSEVGCVKFDFLTSTEFAVDLAAFVPSDWPDEIHNLISTFLSYEVESRELAEFNSIAQEFDLKAIGSGSVVEGRSYEEWLKLLSDSQKDVLANDINTSVRIVGPAGSGKTLALCMRAIQIARDKSVEGEGKRLLVATHSWAMSERIDGVLSTLNGGFSPDKITVFPLLSLLELHAGHIGQQKTNVIGDDSTDGRVKSIEIIGEIILKLDIVNHPGIADWISSAVTASRDSRQRLDLTLNLYEELSGVLTASGVAPDDQESIQEYLSSPREDWMPPFDSIADRGYVIAVYKLFMQELVDRSAITTDQFILDSIRVLETFTWRMRKETEGYDYILIDELQVFDPQERTSLQLLGRSRRGVPFVTAEDPAQGVFSSLNSRRATVDNTPVYLEVVHRFNVQIFEFISYIYQQFPLNALPLKIHDTRGAGKERPAMRSFATDDEAVSQASKYIADIYAGAQTNDRICVVTLGDVDAAISSKLKELGLKTIRLESFDDVERLSYSRKSIVVSPWQFVGGTQFSHVVVLALGISQPSSQFGRLREMVSVYLSCSRATESLNIFCSGYVPLVLSNAADEKLLAV